MSPTTSSRDRIIQAAMDLFLYQGFAPTGLSEIAKKAGVHGGSIYHYFPTKEALVVAGLEKLKRDLWPEFLGPLWDKIDDPIDRVFALLDGYRRVLLMTEFAHGCPVGNLAIELAESHPNVRKLVAENFDGWLAAVEQCFTAAAGRLGPDADPRQLAILSLTTMEGAMMLARTYRDLRAFDAAIASLRDYVERLIESETDWGGQRRARRRAADQDQSTQQ